MEITIDMISFYEYELICVREDHFFQFLIFFDFFVWEQMKHRFYQRDVIVHPCFKVPDPQHKDQTQNDEV